LKTRLADASAWKKLFVRHAASRLRRRLSRCSSLDILGNVVPFIIGEEEKMEEEPQKAPGRWDGARFVEAA